MPSKMIWPFPYQSVIPPTIVETPSVAIKECTPKPATSTPLAMPIPSPMARPISTATTHGRPEFAIIPAVNMPVRPMLAAIDRSN
jgi:hypothetical protein